MKFRSAFAVLSMTVAITACSELPFQQQTTEEAAAASHSGPPGVSPLDQPIETGGEGTAVATGEAATSRTNMFRASGQGWTVTAGGDTAVYERPGQRSVGVGVRRITYARGVEYIGGMNGAVFQLTIRAQECNAGGQTVPFTANLRVGSQRMTGCATAADTMPSAQTRASADAPQPRRASTPARSSAPAPAPARETPAPAAESTPAPTTPATPAPATDNVQGTTLPAPATTPAPDTPTTSPATNTPARPTPAATETPAAAAPTTPAPAATPATPAPAASAPPLVLPAAPTPAEAPSSAADEAEGEDD